MCWDTLAHQSGAGELGLAPKEGPGLLQWKLLASTVAGE